MDELYALALPENGKGVLFAQPSDIHGYGLFTNEHLPAATILSRRLGLREPLSLRDKRAIIGIDGLDQAVPEDVIFKYINHSCHPNAFLNDTGCLVSLETLPENIEITVDYSASLTGSKWELVCLCGDKMCKGYIKAIVT